MSFFEFFTASAEEKEKPKSPFRKLVKSGIEGSSSSFYEIPGRKNDIIRRSWVGVGITEEEQKLLFNESLERRSSLAKKFLDIGKKYGIRMVPTDYFFANDPESGEAALFARSDRVIGASLEKMPAYSQALARELDAMYSGVIRYLKDSFQENGDVWWDFREEQIMYGKTADDPELKAYFVDMDPTLEAWTKWEYNGARLKEDFKRRILRMKTIIDSAEKKTNPPMKFEKARAALLSAEKIFSA